MIDTYVLVNGRIIPEPDTAKWAAFVEGKQRIIEHTHEGDVLVSTVFLGLDHRFGGDGPPILFETMVFNGPLAGEMRRYCTLGEAKIGHWEIHARVIEAML